MNIKEFNNLNKKEELNKKESINILKVYFWLCSLFFLLFFVGLCVGAIYFASPETHMFLVLFFYFNMCFWLFLCTLGYILYFKQISQNKTVRRQKNAK